MRFSKQALRSYIEKRQRAIQDEAGYTFDHRNGSAQVNGKGERLQRLYGQWDELNTLLENLDGGYIAE